ncbi:MAG: FAD-binding protein [Gemmatimonadaceae bacterium]
MTTVAPQPLGGGVDDLANRCAEALGRLERSVRGTVSATSSSRSKFSRDAGRIVQKTPAIVVHSTCEDDVAATLAVARAHGIPVAVRGNGHSVNGGVLCDGGIVLAPGAELRPIARQVGDGMFEISARARWLDVERELNRSGWTVPVHADYLGLSVGGTLSVGCYGERSITSGGQIDHVRKIRLVLADGSARWCSPESSGDLFRFSLAGLGMVGVIERVVIQAEPRRRAASIDTYKHASLGELIDAIEWMDEDRQVWPDTFMGTRFQVLAGKKWDIRWTVGALSSNRRAAKNAPPPRLNNNTPDGRELYRSYFENRSLHVGLWSSLTFNQSRVWTDYVLDFDGARQLTALIERQYRDGAYDGCATSTYVVGIRRPRNALDLPLAPANQTDGSTRVGIGVFSFVPRGDGTRLARARANAAECLQACVNLGGRPYLYGWHELDQSQTRCVYGESLNRLQQLRSEFDPAGLLNAGRIPGIK